MNLEVRLARTEDREGVLAIDKNLYHGGDYLPPLYNSYIADPTRRSFVALLNGRVIGYMQFSFVDDGETMVTQAYRLIPDLRKTGIFNIIIRPHYSILKDFPNLKRVTGATADKELHLKRFKEGKTRRVHLFSRICLPLLLSENTEDKLSAEAASLAGLFTSLPTLQQIKPLTPDSILPVVKDLADRLKLFPHDRLVVSWEPLRLLKSNLKRTVQDNTGFAYITNDSRNSPVSFSIGHINGVLYDIEYYGGDVRDAVAHVFVHLQNLKTLNNYSALRPFLFLPEQLDVELVGELLSTLFSIRLGVKEEVAVIECKVEDYEVLDRKVWSKM